MIYDAWGLGLIWSWQGPPPKKKNVFVDEKTTFKIGAQQRFGICDQVVGPHKSERKQTSIDIRGCVFTTTFCSTASFGRK